MPLCVIHSDMTLFYKIHPSLSITIHFYMTKPCRIINGRAEDTRQHILYMRLPSCCYCCRPTERLLIPCNLECYSGIVNRKVVDVGDMSHAKITCLNQIIECLKNVLIMRCFCGEMFQILSQITKNDVMVELRL